LADLEADPRLAGVVERAREVAGVPGVTTAGHPELTEAIDGFHELYLEARGAKPTWGGKQVAKLNRFMLGARVGAAEVLRRARVMFSMAGRWPVEHGGDLDALVTHFDKFAGGDSAGGKRETAVDAARRIAEQEENPEW
jgi:hypothetical protein